MKKIRSYLEIGPGSKARGDGANKSEETNQKPAGGFLIAHFKRYAAKSSNAIIMKSRKRKDDACTQHATAPFGSRIFAA